ncbi:hypothetical protein PoB_005988400 [Plakobranchus ocellatus]|uniref:PWI domain-containing protein n=1 Tax=Plakobranchus ocellatus TaxID=259542 RepID=A0AAV4CKH8_9GAST|nr:hypothetical protein PoB_005988400 [Plakobranchus ocellatus]
MHFYAGTNAQQDTRFSDKKKKLMKTMRFGEGLERKVDMTKVNVDSLKPWIAQRLTELLGIEDDVVVEFVYNQLEERRCSINKMAFKHSHSHQSLDTWMLPSFLNALVARYSYQLPLG